MRMRIFKEKKGDAVIDGLTILVVVFVFGLLSLTVYSGFMEAEPDIRASLNDSDSATLNQSLASLDMVKNQFPSVFDGALVVILIGLWAFALVSAYFIDTHPIFMIFSAILLIFVFITAAMIGNVGEELLSGDEFSSISGSFPITNWVMSHIFIIVLVIGLSVLLVLYGKSRSRG